MQLHTIFQQTHFFKELTVVIFDSVDWLDSLSLSRSFNLVKILLVEQQPANERSFKECDAKQQLILVSPLPASTNNLNENIPQEEEWCHRLSVVPKVAHETMDKKRVGCSNV